MEGLPRIEIESRIGLSNLGHVTALDSRERRGPGQGKWLAFGVASEPGSQGDIGGPEFPFRVSHPSLSGSGRKVSQGISFVQGTFSKKLSYCHVPSRLTFAVRAWKSMEL